MSESEHLVRHAPASHYPISLRQEALLLLATGWSTRQVCAHLGMHPTTLCSWRRYAATGQPPRAARRVFPPAQKQQLVRELLSGQLRERDAMLKYGVREKRTLRRWVADYQAAATPRNEPVAPLPVEPTPSTTPALMAPAELLTQLRQAQWQVEALQVLIDQAEATYHIAIRKKGGAKPSK